MSEGGRRQVISNFRLSATQRKLIDFHRGTVIHVFDVTDCPSQVRRLVLDEGGQMLECGCLRDGQSSLTKNAVRVLLEETLLECDITVAPEDYEKWARFSPNRPETVNNKSPVPKSSSRTELGEEKPKEKVEMEKLVTDRRILRVREALCPMKVSLDLLNMPNNSANPGNTMRRDSQCGKLDDFPASRILSKEFCDGPRFGPSVPKNWPLLSDPLMAIKGVLRQLPPDVVTEALRVSVAANECATPPAPETPPSLHPRSAPRFAMQNVRPRRKINCMTPAPQAALLPTVKGATVSRPYMGSDS